MLEPNHTNLNINFINVVPAWNSLPAYIVKALHPVLLSRVLLLIL